MPAEAVDITRLQRRAWSAHPATADVLRTMAADEMARSWHDAILRPPLAHFRVLVAIDEQRQVTGFTVIGPSPDDDAVTTEGQIAEFIVDEEGLEHSSRLVNAAVDTLRTDGYETATIWLAADDDERRQFFTECGWAPDGAHREIGSEDETARMKMIRLHTDIRA